MISLGFLGAAWYATLSLWIIDISFHLVLYPLPNSDFFFLRCFLYSVRIANELGKGDAKAAKFSIKVLVSTSLIIGLFFWVVCLIFGRNLGYLFSDEKAVADSVADLSTLLAFSILLNSIYPVLSGKSTQSWEVENFTEHVQYIIDNVP